MKLEESAQAFAVDIAFWMEAVVDPDSPVNELGQLCLELSEKLRALGIVLLVTKADPKGFYFNLVRSGRAWRTYLTRIQNEKATEDHHYCTGRFNPIIDSIAAGQFEMAREIATLSPQNWRKGHEYEDDYCYGRFLELMVQAEPPVSDVTEVIAQFERYVAGDEHARLEMARALINDDQDEFEEAFQSLVDAHDAAIEENKASGQLEEPLVVAQRRVFVEGLAVLRIAEKQGFETAAEYDYCPSLGRVTVTDPLPEDNDPGMDGWLS